MLMTRSRSLALTLAATLLSATAFGQFITPNPQAPAPRTYKDTTMLKPPAGAKVAIWEFVDMECPACAHAAPMIHAASVKYHIPVVRKDFPLGPSHPWSMEAAVYARYMQDKLPNGPNIADQYRAAIFANQININGKDDLLRATQKFLADRQQALPFVIDPQGELANEVKADKALGDRIGIMETPTIWVVTDHAWQQLTDFNQLEAMIEAAQKTVPAAKK